MISCGPCGLIDFILWCNCVFELIFDSTSFLSFTKNYKWVQCRWFYSLMIKYYKKFKNPFSISFENFRINFVFSSNFVRAQNIDSFNWHFLLNSYKINLKSSDVFRVDKREVLFPIPKLLRKNTKNKVSFINILISGHYFYYYSFIYLS